MPPPEMHEDAENGYVWKLKKYLYGVTYGGAQFEDTVHETLLKLKWKRISGLKHLWVKMDNKQRVLGYLCTYVDDFLAIGVNVTAKSLLEEIGTLLNIEANGTEVRFIGNHLRNDGNIVSQLLPSMHYEKGSYIIV